MVYKYCIIGTGIGGGVLLDNLANSEESIAVIEAGSKIHNKKEHYESVGLPFKFTTSSVQLGGTSNLWHGVLGHLDEVDFEKRAWIPYSGWPINKEELDRYYDKAAIFWGVENTDFFDIEKLSDEFKKDLNKLSFNKDFLENKIFQQPKQIKSLKNHIINIVQKNKNIHLYLQTIALKLICKEPHNEINSCIVGLPDGTLKEVFAEKFILCSGALETPRVLLNSEGINNKNIGKFLMDHPIGNLLQIEFKNPHKAPLYSDTRYGLGTKIKTGLIFKKEIQEKHRLPNHNIYIRPSFIKGIDDQSEKLKLAFAFL